MLSRIEHEKKFYNHRAWKNLPQFSKVEEGMEVVGGGVPFLEKKGCIHLGVNSFL